MLDTLLTINWNPDPTLFHLFGFPILYYSLLWIVGIACSYLIVKREYRDLKIGDDKFDPLFIYCFDPGRLPPGALPVLPAGVLPERRETVLRNDSPH